MCKIQYREQNDKWHKKLPNDQRYRGKRVYNQEVQFDCQIKCLKEEVGDELLEKERKLWQDVNPRLKSFNMLS